MRDTMPAIRDLVEAAQNAGPNPGTRVSQMAAGLVGSEILKIAAEIRALSAGGRKLCDLTVGDFNPRHFPVPRSLVDGINRALAQGETNYPPSNGMPELRHAIRRFYERELGLLYPIESVLVAAGARPIIYGIYRTLCDPGDRVVYPVPSWNNNHYVHMLGAIPVPVGCPPQDRFLPTRESLRDALPGARLLCLCSPLNPAGTAFSSDALHGICEAVLEENRRREARAERPLYVLYDHVYWMLCFGSAHHETPPGLLPEMARYTLFVDGISKSFAATGVRVGWGVGPVDLIARMSAILGHVGAWAPRAEQVATVGLLDDAAGVRSFQAGFRLGIETRLHRLHQGFRELQGAGLPVESIPPMGAIYLTVRIHPFGRRTPQGAVLTTNEAVRRYLLEAAALAIVPFQAFGAQQDDGWFRLSVGAVDEQDIVDALPRLRAALEALA